MKILMVFTSKFHYSGITSVVMNYYRELVKYEDCVIDFVVPNNVDEVFKEEFRINGSKVFKIPMKIRRALPIFYIKKLKRILKENKYDIVHVHGSSSIMAIELMTAKLANIRIRIAHSHNTTTEHRIIHKFLKPIFDNLYTDAFACGKEAGKWLFNEKQFYVVKNAQSIEKFKFNDLIRKEYRDKYYLNNKFIIGHVGGFNFQKNHDFLIDVFNEICKEKLDAYLVLIGEGEFMSTIKEKVDNLKLQNKVLFVGKSTKVNEWLNAFDLMVLPSRYEGLPNVLIEWQISGLKSIVSDKVTTEAKITDLIDFEPLDVNIWKEKILNFKEDISRVNDKNIKLIKENGFDIETNARELYLKYKELINKNGGNSHG